MRELDRRITITRLGESVDKRRRLLPTAIARVRNVLVDYRGALDAAAAGPRLALATSAVRDAENGEAFLGEIEWSYGFSTRLLTGEEEALLTYRGVSAGRGLPVGTLVLDVGGGSTELIVGARDGVSFHASLDLGCVRLSERFLASDPPSREELDACAGYVRSLLAEQVPASVRPTAAVGVAGTVTTLATLDLELDEEDPELVHGHRMASDGIEDELERVARTPLSELRARPGIHPDRAPVLVAGVVVVLETLRHFELDHLEASEHDIMHGGALAAAELAEPSDEDAPPQAFTCC